MKRKLRLEVYRPKKKIRVSKDDTVPFLVRVGGTFVALGGFVSFAVTGMIMGVKSFFDLKQKIYNRNILNKKYIELRIKKR